MHKTHSRKRMFLFLCVLAMLALGCRVITDLFRRTDEPNVNQPEQAVQVQPNEPEPIAPELAEPEEEETPGEQNGAGPQGFGNGPGSGG